MAGSNTKQDLARSDSPKPPQEQVLFPTLQARVEESALRQPETQQCVAERIRAWQFPAATSGLPTRVRHGFVFRTK